MNNRNALLSKWVSTVFAISLFFFIVIVYFTTKSQPVEKEDISYINILGQYSENYKTDTETWQEYSPDIEINGIVNSLAIKGHVQNEIPLGKEVLMYIYQLDVEVFINGNVYYKSGSQLGTRWDSFLSPGITKDDEVSIILNPNTRNFYSGSYTMFLNKLCCGTSYGLLLNQLSINFWKILISVIVFIIGIAILVAMCGLKFLGIEDVKGYLSCALLLIAGSICTFIDYEYITLIFNNSIMVNIVDFVSQMLICLFLIMYLKNYLITKRHKTIIQISIYFWMFMIVLYFILRIFFNIYEDQLVNAYIIIVLIIIFSEIVFLFLEFRTYNEKQTKYVLVSGVTLAFFAVTEIIHFILNNVFWIYVFQIGLLLFTIIQFIMLLNYTKIQLDKANRIKEIEADNIKKDAEIQKANVSIMLSQIQPHFLYNALSSIAALCDENPEMAKKATVDFSRFLRGNMDSLAADKPISFEQEIAHTKNYLSLEQVRFPDRLNVEYDLKTTMFRLPTLTLQPIVENAVRYGVTKKIEGGTVKISTFEDEKAFYIRVEDDGVGYDPLPPKSDGRTHIGISNVKDRLMKMCGGTLEIESTLGVGTKAFITIPKEKK